MAATPFLFSGGYAFSSAGYAKNPIRLPNPAMVAQEVIDRLTRPFRRLLTPSKCSLNFPVEIVLMIASHLDECALASFALTCKSLFRLWERQPLQPDQKEKLLLLLEEDIPFLYYCHYCTKLHRWHRRWSRSITPWYEEHLPCKGNRDEHLYVTSICHVPYYVARVIMSRHFSSSKHGSNHGSKHGFPFHILNKRARSGTNFDGVVCSEFQQARIVNDQLMVLSVISITHPQDDILRHYLNFCGHSVCRHLTLSKQLPESIPARLPEVARKGNASQFLACGPTFGACTFCLTDYRISILWQGAKGYKIEVFIYHNLGDCRTPFDWHWHSISKRYLGEELTTRLEYSLDYRPGIVREQWNKAVGIADH